MTLKSNLSKLRTQIMLTVLITMKQHFLQIFCRGSAALKTNTNQFYNDNIEIETTSRKIPISKTHSLYTSIGIFVLALISILIYAGLVIWRMQLEYVLKGYCLLNSLCWVFSYKYQGPFSYGKH